MSMIATRKEDKLVNYLCMTGHICADINQGALSATLPFLVMYDGYSYTAVAGLIFAANIASAVIQPLFGAIGDHRACPWFMALGVFLAGLGMCGIGFFDAYWTVLASAMISGIGVAMFHPEGGRLSNLAAGARKANGMSIFAVGGNIGFFVGPLMAAVFLTVFGMHGTLAFLFPTTICAIVLLAFNKRFLSMGIAKNSTTQKDAKPERWGNFALAMGVLSCRSIVEYGLMAFIPLFFVSVLGQGETFGSLMLSVFAIAGAVATHHRTRRRVQNRLSLFRNSRFMPGRVRIQPLTRLGRGTRVLAHLRGQPVLPFLRRLGHELRAPSSGNRIGYIVRRRYLRWRHCGTAFRNGGRCLRPSAGNAHYRGRYRDRTWHGCNRETPQLAKATGNTTPDKEGGALQSDTPFSRIATRPHATSTVLHF